MGTTQEQHRPDLRTFGRRRGRKLSPRQEALLQRGRAGAFLDLARAAPADVATLFPVPVAQVWIEIGFGSGEHLLWQAAQNPTIGFIGCEPYVDGVVKVLDAIEGSEVRNVRVHADDARHLLRWLPPGCIAKVFLLFPDPWPKARHRKRRLINPDVLEALSRVLAPGGELRVATDVGDYAGGVLLAVQRQQAFRWLAAGAHDWRERPADWPGTRYEQKAIAAGRRCYYLTFSRR